MKAGFGPLSKLPCLYSEKNYFWLKNGQFSTSFRGRPILSLSFTIYTARTRQVIINKTRPRLNRHGHRLKELRKTDSNSELKRVKVRV